MSKLIAVDIGHGSDTLGKCVLKGKTIYREHSFNSAVGIEVDKMLRANGFSTFMVQKPNSPEYPLMDRIDEYNKQGVDLVWSIHADANDNLKAIGRYCFYWHTSKEGKRLAEMYAEEVKAAGYSLRGDGTQSSKVGDWTNLAICRDTDMTAVLTENGFYTNEDDFKLIFKTRNYVKDMARVITRSICRFYGVTYKDINETSSPSPGTNAGTSGKVLYKVQVGAFSNKANADKLVAELKKKGYEAIINEG